MAQLDLIKELKAEEQKLKNKLLAIQNLLIAYGNSSEVHNEPSLPFPSASGTPKGDNTWEEYVLIMLNEIGGKGKTKDVAKAIEEANPSLNKTRILQATRHQLSKLQIASKINHTPGKYLKDGYTYELKK